MPGDVVARQARLVPPVAPRQRQRAVPVQRRGERGGSAMPAASRSARSRDCPEPTSTRTSAGDHCSTGRHGEHPLGQAGHLEGRRRTTRPDTCRGRRSAARNAPGGGTDTPVTVLTRSGRCPASAQATAAPQSWPTTCAARLAAAGQRGLDDRRGVGDQLGEAVRGAPDGPCSRGVAALVCGHGAQTGGREQWREQRPSCGRTAGNPCSNTTGSPSGGPAAVRSKTSPSRVAVSTPRILAPPRESLHSGARVATNLARESLQTSARESRS